MSLDFSTALPLILLGLALLVVAVWLLTRRNRKAKVVEDGSAPALARDVLDEGAEKARRNQALIDAAPAAVKVMAEPVPVPMPMPAPAPAPAAADDLTRIKGLGPKLVTLLGELGVTSYAQIAAWSDADVERIDAELGRFKGRITRDQWIEQAKLLAAGDEVAFTDKFGRNG
jgi:predicted flap endonuclease-1-like 5' DNA nuclease